MKWAGEATLLGVHQVRVMCEGMGGQFQKRPDTRCTSIPNKPGWCWIRTKMGTEDDFMVAEWGTCSSETSQVPAMLVKMRTHTGCLGPQDAPQTHMSRQQWRRVEGWLKLLGSPLGVPTGCWALHNLVRPSSGQLSPHLNGHRIIA